MVWVMLLMLTRSTSRRVLLIVRLRVRPRADGQPRGRLDAHRFLRLIIVVLVIITVTAATSTTSTAGGQPVVEEPLHGEERALILHRFHVAPRKHQGRRFVGGIGGARCTTSATTTTTTTTTMTTMTTTMTTTTTTTTTAAATTGTTGTTSEGRTGTVVKDVLPLESQGGPASGGGSCTISSRALGTSSG